MSSPYWEATAPDLKAAGEPVILAVGAIEQHGPHLPVGTDALVARHVMQEIVAQVRELGVPLLEGPTVWAGASAHHLSRGGTISVSSRTLHAYLLDIVASLHRSGHRRVILVNGHGGNEDIVNQVAKDACAELDGIRCLPLSYWPISMPALLDLGREYGVAHVPGHAGAFERALLEVIDPGLVRADRFPDPDQARARAAQVSSWTVGAQRNGWVEEIDGYSDDPRAGTIELGRRALALIREDVTARALHFLREPG